MACLGNSKELKSLRSYMKNMWVIQMLQAAGHEALFVGGAVRDMILGRTAKDWDVATSATPEQIIDLFQVEKTHGKAPASFGVVCFREEDGTYLEVASFRDDSQMKDRYDGSPLKGTIQTDTFRRDFTMNSIFWDPIKDVFIDLANGIKDLEEGILRTCNDAQFTFSQDPVRVLRAVRFCKQLNLAPAFNIEEFLPLVDWKSERVRAEMQAISKV